MRQLAKNAGGSVDLARFFQAALFGPNRLRPAFADGHQEDASEFAVPLLQTLNASSLHDIIRRNFEFEQRQAIQCTTCARRTSQAQGMLSLEVAIDQDSLPVEYKACAPLAHIIGQHFQPEYVESACHGAVNALRKHTLTIRSFGPFVLLVVKRFRYSQLMDETRKLDQRISVQQTVRIQASHFRVLAVVMHEGKTAHAGHYTTLGLNTNSGDYFLFDNARKPRKVSFSTFAATEKFQRDAYMFVLAREDGGAAVNNNDSGDED